MSLDTATLEDITIPNGTAVSRVVRAYNEYFDALAIQLYAPATLDALTYTLETADDDAFTINIRTIQTGDPPTDLAPPAAGKFRDYLEALPRTLRFRIKASGNVTADKTWKCTKTWR